MTSSDPGHKLTDILKTQRFAVLATQWDGQPYGSLVAFAAPDTSSILFPTSRDSRKHANLLADSRVALVFDNRSNTEDDLRAAVAVTAVGRADEVCGEERNILASEFLLKHPALEAFLAQPSTVLVRVRVERYLVVSEFQEVVEITYLQT